MSIHHIFDAGSLHTYRTEIPNTVVRGRRSQALSIYAKWLYVYLKSVAGDDDQCSQSTTHMATAAGMSRSQISRARKELEQSTLIHRIAGTYPNRQTHTIRIRNIWLENMQEYHRADMTEIPAEANGCAFGVSIRNTNTNSGVSNRDTRTEPESITSGVSNRDTRTEPESITSGVSNRDTRSLEKTNNYVSGVSNRNTRILHIYEEEKKDLKKDLKKKRGEGSVRGEKRATVKHPPTAETPLPEPFPITPKMHAWFDQNIDASLVPLDRATEKWKNSMLSTQRRYRNWEAAWRNGMLRAEEWARDRLPVPPVLPRRCPPHTVRRNFSDNWICKDCHAIFSDATATTLRTQGAIL